MGFKKIALSLVFGMLGAGYANARCSTNAVDSVMSSADKDILECRHQGTVYFCHDDSEEKQRFMAGACRLKIRNDQALNAVRGSFGRFETNVDNEYIIRSVYRHLEFILKSRNPESVQKATILGKLMVINRVRSLHFSNHHSTYNFLGEVLFVSANRAESHSIFSSYSPQQTADTIISEITLLLKAQYQVKQLIPSIKKFRIHFAMDESLAEQQTKIERFISLLRENVSRIKGEIEMMGAEELNLGLSSGHRSYFVDYGILLGRSMMVAIYGYSSESEASRLFQDTMLKLDQLPPP